MFREALTSLVAVAVLLTSTVPVANAQFTPAPQGQNPPTGDSTAPGYPPQGYPPQAGPDGQPPPNSGQSQDPNGETQPDPAADRQHGVARISVVQGDVNVKRGDNGELTGAVMNAPLMTQDHLQTSDGSRSEVELDSANLLRLAPNTDVGFADIEYHQFQIQLGEGTVIYRVLRDSQGQVEIETPNISFRPTSEGEFRISVLPDGTTEMTARSGQGEIASPKGSETIAAGQTLLVRGNPADPEFQQIAELGRDQFDDWSANRDRQLLGSQSYRYVSRDIYGADDLDAYGNWVPSQYGQVWAPQSQGADWAPYSTGQWNYEPYYGWTWVDSAPWGWAPYHYGRWFHNGSYGWCWWPGAVSASYAWNPALVGFFGWGGFGVSLGIGGLGWVALAPFEAFHPWWGHGFYGHGGWGYGYGGHGWFRPYGGGYGRFDVARSYRNAAFRGGAITAGYRGFGGPHQRFAAATRGQLTNANMFRGQVPLAPTRSSYQLSNRQAFANPRLASVSGRQFFRAQNVGTAGHVNPRNGSTGFRSVAGAPQSMHGVAPNMQRGFSGPNRNVYSGSSSAGSGWQRFGDPGRGNNALRQNFAGGSEQSGWHRFGQPQPYSNNANRYSNNGNRAPSFGGGSSSFGSRNGMSAPRYSAPSSSGFGSSSGRYNPGHVSEPSNHGPFSGGHNGQSFGGSHSGGSFGGGHSGGGHSGGSGGGGHHH